MGNVTVAFTINMLCTIVVITHDLYVAEKAKRIVKIIDGKLS